MRHLASAWRTLLVVAAVGAALPALVETAAADPGDGATAVPSSACTWSVEALPLLPGAASGFIRGGDGRGTFAGESGDRPVLWRDGRAVQLGASGYAQDVNRSGDAVGESGGHAVLWRGTAEVPLAEPPGVTSSSATAVNDAGLVVGYGSGPDTGGAQGLVWQADAPDHVRVLAAGPEPSSVFPADVDRHGVIVGTQVAGSSLRLSAVIGTLRSGLHPLPPLPAAVDSGAAAVAGRYVVGWDSAGAVRWVHGRPERLPGGGAPAAVNAHGLVAGSHGPPGVAYVWQDGARIELPGLLPGSANGATTVTASGQVGGFSSLTTDGEIRYAPAVWTCR